MADTTSQMDSKVIYTDIWQTDSSGYLRHTSVYIPITHWISLLDLLPSSDPSLDKLLTRVLATVPSLVYVGVILQSRRLMIGNPNVRYIYKQI
ncbi:hypothetical protein BDW72DRAFT_167685 [Aspergillus terricola var. indicus]